MADSGTVVCSLSFVTVPFCNDYDSLAQTRHDFLALTLEKPLLKPTVLSLESNPDRLLLLFRLSLWSHFNRLEEVSRLPP